MSNQLNRLVPRFGMSFSSAVSRTVQSDRDKCNINNIMRKFATTGLIDFVNPNQGLYEDVSDVPSYEDAQNARVISREIYDNLPDEIKKAYSYEEIATGEVIIDQPEPEPEPNPESSPTPDNAT